MLNFRIAGALSDYDAPSRCVSLSFVNSLLIKKGLGRLPGRSTTFTRYPRNSQPKTRGARSWSFYILGAGETPAPQPETSTGNIVVQASSLQKTRAERAFHLSEAGVLCWKEPISNRFTDPSRGLIPSLDQHSSRVKQLKAAPHHIIL